MEKPPELIPSPYLKIPVRIQWTAREYIPRQKSADWYYIVWVISIAIAIGSILFHNIIFAIFILIATFALSLYAGKPAELLSYEITEKGIISNRYFYPYETLESFGIDTETGNIPKLLVKSKKLLMPLIIIPIENIETEEIRNVLGSFLHQENLTEPLFYKLMDYLGF